MDRREYDVRQYVPVCGDRKFRIYAELIGKHLPLVGIVDKNNGNLLEALEEKWINPDGNLTEAGKVENDRRLELMSDGSSREKAMGLMGMKEKKPKVRIREAHGKSPEKIAKPKDKVNALLVKHGYEGNYKITKDADNGGYVLTLFRPGQQDKNGGKGVKQFSGELSIVLNKLDVFLST